MARAGALSGQAAQPRERIETRVAFTRLRIGSLWKEQFAVFGDEEKDQAIDEPQQLAIVILFIERARSELFEQLLVGRVSEEALTKEFNGLFDAVTQLVERACTDLNRLL